MIPFNRPRKGLLPQISRVPINIDDGAQYKALEACKINIARTIMFKKNPVFSIGSTAEAVQWKHGESWMHGVTVKPNRSDNRGCSYTIWVTKTGRIITCNTKHIQATPILRKTII